MLTPGTADARFVLFTYGETVHEYGRPKKPLPDVPSDVKIGYKYWYCGVFFVNAWTQDGEYCLYSRSKRTAEPIDRATAAELLGVPEGDIPPPSAYRFPPLSILAGMVLLVAGPLWKLGAFGGSNDDARARTLLADSRYAAALAAVADAGPDLAAVRKAIDREVETLSALGVPAAEARSNLVFLVRTSPAAPPAPAPTA